MRGNAEAQWKNSAFHDMQFADFAVADAGLDGEGVGFQVDVVAVRKSLHLQFGHDFRAKLFDPGAEHISRKLSPALIPSAATQTCEATS